MQKFKKGDHVMIAKDLGSSMSHFTNNTEAIVIYSYDDEYGGGNTKDYGIYIKGKGQAAWYREEQLTLIEKNRIDLLKKWESEADAESKLKSDLDWIFANGKHVLENTHGSSISALAECFGLTNLWGSHGEGFVYYQNAMQTLLMAKPYLEKNDKIGWLTFCKELKDKCV